MKKNIRSLMKPIRGVIMALSIATTLQAASKFTDWSTPTNLGPAVNSSFSDSAPAVSKNGLSLYLTSVRPGGLGEGDIYVSQRSSVDEPWGPPVNVFALNTPGTDQAPALSRDDHYLFFATDRPGGRGGLDIWVSRRENIHDDFDWETPVPITEINSSVNDAGPAYFENDEGRPQLYFQSQRPGGAGLADFYQTEQQEDGTWSAPQRVAELSTPFQEQRPSIRFDGLEIVFTSTRPPSVGFDLWVSTRASVTDAWSQPVRLNINSPQGDTGPYLSGDGMTLYFTSDRAGGFGGGDLWVSTRERRRGNQ
jgi:Tol biopolymer transport system component